MLFANLSSFGVEKAGFSTTLIDFSNAYKSTQHSVSLYTFFIRNVAQGLIPKVPIS